MGAPEVPYPSRCEPPLGVLRLHLALRFERGAVAGAWWPYGRDLTREGPHLVHDYPSGRGRVDRLVYCPDDWDVVAEEVFTSHGRIKVGFFPPGKGSGLVLLRLVGLEIIRLRVVWADSKGVMAG